MYICIYIICIYVIIYVYIYIIIQQHPQHLDRIQCALGNASQNGKEICCFEKNVQRQ